jgi:hypothetical protein
MLQRGPDLVLEGQAIVDRGRGFVLGVCGWRASLAYERFYYAVEGAVVVFAGCAEGEEILGCFGRGFAEDFEFEVTEGGVKLRTSLVKRST